VYKIKTVNAGSPGSITLWPPGPQTAVSTSNYKIFRQPRTVDAELLEMPQSIVIDLTPRGIGGGKWDLPIPTATTPVDIIFAPDGRVIPAIGGYNLSAMDKIILWVRDVNLGVADGQNDPTLVVVYPRTGLVASQPVDVANLTTSPYTFTITGQTSR
jgi:hypothetical protein